MKHFFRLLALLLIIAGFSSQPLSAEVGDIFKSGSLWYKELPKSSVGACVAVIPSQGEKYSGEITIPASVAHYNEQSGVTSSFVVTNVADSAFVGSSVTSINLPGSMREIGDYAFAYCSSLRSFEFANSPMLTQIGEYVWSDDQEMISFKIPSMMKADFDPIKAFDGCLSMRSFQVDSGNALWLSYDGVLYRKMSNGKYELCIYPAAKEDESFDWYSGCTKVGPNAFKQRGVNGRNRIGLKELMIPDVVTEISEGSFSRLKYLQTVELGAGITRIPQDCFVSIGDGQNINFKFGPNVEEVDTCAFWLADFGSFGTLELNEGLKIIRNNAFEAVELRTINFPSSLEKVESRAFSGSALQSLTLPAGVEFGNEVFYACTELRTLTIAEGVTDIPYGMFILADFYNLNIPASVKTIGSKAFQQVMSLRKVTVAPENEYFKAVDNVLFNKEMTDLLLYPVQRFNAENKIDKSYTVPNGVKRLAIASFACNSHLTEVVLPESLDSIGPLSFGRMDNLEKINIPSGVHYIPESTFDGSSKLSNLIIHDDIYEIKDLAFNGCSSLKDFNLPKNIRNIGKKAFYNALAFQELTFPDGLENIGYEAFYQAAMSGVINIPASLKNWANRSFMYSGDYNEIIINTDIPIPSEAFAKTMRPKKVTIGKNVKEIGSAAFGHVVIDMTDGSSYGTIEEVVLEEGLETIHTSAFYAQIFERIEVPNSVKYIGSAALSSGKLRFVSLGESVDTVGIINELSPNFETLVCKAEIPPYVIPAEYSSFDLDALCKNSDYEKVILYVPDNSIEDYKAADYWRKFLNIKPLSEYLSGVDGVTVDSPMVTVSGRELRIEGKGNVEVFNLSGQSIYSGSATTVTVPDGGVYIVRVNGKTYKLSLN